MDARLIGSERHRAPERVDLLDQMALSDAPDRGVARHLAQRLDVVREQKRAATYAGRGERGLRAGMTAADDNDVETHGKLHGFAWKAARRNERR